MTTRLPRNWSTHWATTATTASRTRKPTALCTRLPLEHFDACIVDHQLPGLDNRYLLRKIRELDPPVPMLVLTARGAETGSGERLGQRQQRLPGQAAAYQRVARAPGCAGRGAGEPPAPGEVLFAYDRFEFNLKTQVVKDFERAGHDDPEGVPARPAAARQHRQGAVPQRHPRSGLGPQLRRAVAHAGYPRLAGAHQAGAAACPAAICSRPSTASATGWRTSSSTEPELPTRRCFTSRAAYQPFGLCTSSGATSSASTVSAARCLVLRVRLEPLLMPLEPLDQRQFHQDREMVGAEVRAAASGRPRRSGRCGTGDPAASA